MNPESPELRPEALLAQAAFVAAVARGLVQGDLEAEDLVQETLVKALERPPRKPGALRAWLGRVACRLAWNAGRQGRRRERRERLAATPEQTPSPVEILAFQEELLAVGAAVKALPDPLRVAVHLRYFEGLGPPAIAERLGEPVETVKSRLKHALARLRELLDESHGGDRERWMGGLAPLLALDAPDAIISGAAGGATASMILGGIAMKKLLLAGSGIVLLVLLLVSLQVFSPGSEGTAADQAPGPLAAAESPASAARPTVPPGPVGAPEATSARTRVEDAPGMGRLHGIVYGETGPVARAMVLVFGEQKPGEDPAPPLGKTRSDASGAYTLACLPPDQALVVDLLAAAEGHRPGFLESVAVPPGGMRLDVRLERGLAIEGFACDAERRPVSGLELIAASEKTGFCEFAYPSALERRLELRPAEWREGYREQRTMTDVDGRFRISGLAPDQWHLFPGVYEWVVDPSIAVPAGSSGVELVVHPCMVLEALVLDGPTRQPVARFSFDVTPWAKGEAHTFSVSGYQGRLRIGMHLKGKFLEPDRFVIHVQSADHLQAKKEVQWTGARRLDLGEILLERKEPVVKVERRVRVAYDDGAPYSGYWPLKYRKTGSDPWKQVQPELIEPGLYRVETEAGELEVQALRGRGRGWNSSLDPWTWHGTWSSGDSEHGPVIFQRFSRVALRFDPRRCLSRPLPLALRLHSDRGWGQSRRMQVDDLTEGTAAFEDLPPGRYEFFITSGDNKEEKICTSGQVEVPPGTDCSFALD